MYIIHTYIFIYAALRYHTVVASVYSVYTLSYIQYIYSSLYSPPLSQNPVYRLEKNLLHGRLFGVVRIYFFLRAPLVAKNHPCAHHHRPSGTSSSADPLQKYIGIIL